MNPSFDSVIADLHLLRHPFYQAWMQGALSQEILKDYARQYYFHVDRFPRYISAIHSNCENGTWRNELLKNLNDEEGSSGLSSHPELWLQFAEGLGLDRKDVLATTPRPAIQDVTSIFFGCARASFHEGVGALYAYESQVPEIAKSKIEGLKQYYGIQDQRTLCFFEVHQKADIEHRKVLLNMLENFPETEKSCAKESARRAAKALWDFLSDVQEQELAHA